MVLAPHSTVRLTLKIRGTVSRNVRKLRTSGCAFHLYKRSDVHLVANVHVSEGLRGRKEHHIMHLVFFVNLCLDSEVLSKQII